MCKFSVLVFCVFARLPPPNLQHLGVYIESSFKGCSHLRNGRTTLLNFNHPQTDVLQVRVYVLLVAELGLVILGGS